MIQEMRLKTEEIEQLRSDRRQGEMEGMTGSKGPQVGLKPRAAAARTQPQLATNSCVLHVK